ncbi:MAG: hypothetical protein WAM04_17615 [Candidatus Sulfotelmatobacter sp.]
MGLSTRLVAGLVLLFAASLPFFAQSAPCPPSKALLSSSDPAYPDATQLSQRLENHDFTIHCIFPTKFGSVFMVEQNGVLVSTIEGEACLRTNFGDIGVVFVPKPQTFADFKITEHREGGGYLYRFSGTPRVHGGDKFKFGTARRSYFLKRDNLLFIVGDNRLLGRLEEALPPPSP